MRGRISIDSPVLYAEPGHYVCHSGNVRNGGPAHRHCKDAQHSATGPALENPGDGIEPRACNEANSKYRYIPAIRYSTLTGNLTSRSFTLAFKNLFKSLFGGGDSESTGSPAAKPEENQEYKDFTISPTPIPEGGQFRTAGTISKTVDGETRSSEFIRADNHSSRDSAVEHAIGKAKQIIDERGDSLLETTHC